MKDDEDYSNFDPRAHWKEVNNESISGVHILKHDREALDRIIEYLQEEHTLNEMISVLQMKRTELIRYLGMLRFLKGIILHRKQLKGCVGYRVEDGR